MTEPPFAQLPGVCVHESNLLEARMIVTTYNQHVRLLSSEPFGWFAPPKFTRAWEPTLFMESLRSLSLPLSVGKFLPPSLIGWGVGYGTVLESRGWDPAH